jgi:hypothetical protein
VKATCCPLSGKSAQFVEALLGVPFPKTGTLNGNRVNTHPGTAGHDKTLVKNTELNISDKDMTQRSF